MDFIPRAFNGKVAIFKKLKRSGFGGMNKCAHVYLRQSAYGELPRILQEGLKGIADSLLCVAVFFFDISFYRIEKKTRGYLFDNMTGNLANFLMVVKPEP